MGHVSQAPRCETRRRQQATEGKGDGNVCQERRSDVVQELNLVRTLRCSSKTRFLFSPVHLQYIYDSDSPIKQYRIDVFQLEIRYACSRCHGVQILQQEGLVSNHCSLEERKIKLTANTLPRAFEDYLHGNNTRVSFALHEQSASNTPEAWAAGVGFAFDRFQFRTCASWFAFVLEKER